MCTSDLYRSQRSLLVELCLARCGGYCKLQRGDVAKLVPIDVAQQEGIATRVGLKRVDAPGLADRSREEVRRNAAVGANVEDYVAFLRAIPVEVIFNGGVFLRKAVDLELES